MKDEFKIKFNDYKLKSRRELVVFLISIISLIFVFFNVIKLNIILGTSRIFLLELLFRIIVIISTLYTIVFLPTYPIFFIIFKKKDFNLLEKLNFTIVANLSFYILSGYLGFILGIPITALFFFLILIIFFSSIVVYIIIAEYKIGSYIFIKSKNPHKNDNKNVVFNSKPFKSLIQSNGFLLIVFLFLICVLNGKQLYQPIV